MRARLAAALVTATALLVVVPAAAHATTDDCAPTTSGPSLAALACESAEPVASADPAFSDAFVVPVAPVAQALAPASPCRAADVVWYTATDWYRLAQKLRAQASACADYHVSVPALTTGRMPRPGEAPRIRALGPQMHAMAEIHWTGWNAWMTTNPGKTWYEAGVEARRQMALAGYDTTLGDSWAINELPSGIRSGAGAAAMRQNVRDFVHGLYDGDGTDPTPGLVWTAGIGHATGDATTYKLNLRAWLADTAFWEDMQRYVRFWSQEVYASTLQWGVPGTGHVARRDALDEYLQHMMTVAEASPADVASMRQYLEQSYTPLGNMAYWYASGFGFTQVPIAVMQAFVANQVYAMRNRSGRSPWRTSDSFGFAYAIPATIDAPLTRPEVVAMNGDLIDSTAAAIRASDVPATPEATVDEIGAAACGVAGAACAGDVAGAAYNPAWQVFRAWNFTPEASPSGAALDEDTVGTFALVASDLDKDLVEYRVVTPPAHGTFAQDANAASGRAWRNVTYTPAPDWSGTDTLSFVAIDTQGAQSGPATVTITVRPVNDPPTVTVAAVAPLDEGSPTPVTATATDVDGDALGFAWATDVGAVTGTTATGSLLVDDGPAIGTVSVTADDGHGGTAAASAPFTVRNVAPAIDAGPAVRGFWGVPVTLAGTVTDPSAADTAAGLGPVWTLGDGTTAIGASVTHTYAAQGTFTATLGAADDDGGTASDQVTVTIGPRPTAIEYVGPPALPMRGGTVSARLLDVSGTVRVPLAGERLVVRVGDDRCVAVTSADGVASCEVGRAHPGPLHVVLRYRGGELFMGSRAVAAPVVYATTRGGTFLVGDRATGDDVLLRGRSWARENPLSGGAAPSGFRGWVDADDALACGASWDGRSSGAPDADDVPGYVAVAVVSSVARDGRSVQGRTVSVVVVRLDDDHGDRHRGGDEALTGTIVARLCG